MLMTGKGTNEVSVHLCRALKTGEREHLCRALKTGEREHLCRALKTGEIT